MQISGPKRAEDGPYLEDIDMNPTAAQSRLEELTAQIVVLERKIAHASGDEAAVLRTQLAVLVEEQRSVETQLAGAKDGAASDQG